MRRIAGPSPAMAVALLALFIALGGTGYAVLNSGVPDAQGVFHGCANKKTGALRLTARAGACKKKKGRFPGELEVAWAQRGLPGAAGAAGANGTSVVARMNSTAGVTTSATTQTIALNPATWNQAAGDINDFEATISYHAPATLDCAAKTSPSYQQGELDGVIKVDGQEFGKFTVLTDDTAADKTDRLGFKLPFWDGNAASHTVSIEVTDQCKGAAPQHTLAHFTISNVKIAVLAYR